MGQLSMTAETVLPSSIVQRYVKVEPEMKICIHKSCPRVKKSVFKSLKRFFVCHTDEIQKCKICKSEKLPASLRTITEMLKHKWRRGEIKPEMKSWIIFSRMVQFRDFYKYDIPRCSLLFTVQIRKTLEILFWSIYFLLSCFFHSRTISAWGRGFQLNKRDI